MSTPAWFDRGLCQDTDPEQFFVDTHGGARERKKVAVDAAKAICRRCRVRQDCLEWALERRERGIWGGTTERERTQLRKGKAA